MDRTAKSDQLDRLRIHAEQAFPEYRRDLERLVSVDSGSYDSAGVDRVSELLAGRLQELGGSVRRYPNPDLGDTVVATFQGRLVGPTVVVIGHADTVFAVGEAAARPFTVKDDRATGPGVYDMKGGLLVGLGALIVLRAHGHEEEDWLPVGKLVFIVNPDEEIGSPASTSIIRELAAGADMALVLEGARANGDVVAARSGMTHLRIDIHGVAAHAGVEPEKGRSAVLEAAHKTLSLHDLNGRTDGVTVNVGEFRGGSRPNIVADEATLTVDVRARKRSDQAAVEAAIHDLAEASTVPDVTSTVELLARHWPMERSAASGRLLEHAVALASELGFKIQGVAAGGGSDANTTAGMGIASLDGLGPIGGNAHATNEYIELDSVVPRMVLLAALLMEVGRDPELRA